MRIKSLMLASFLGLNSVLFSQNPSCNCGPGITAKGCSISETVYKLLDNEKTQNGPTARFGGVGIIRDIDKTKGWRFLAVPLQIGPQGRMQLFSDLATSAQESLISTALAAGESASSELGAFGLAQNNYQGKARRLQCQIHIHIGTLNNDKHLEDLNSLTIFTLDQKGFDNIRSGLSDGWIIHATTEHGIYHFHPVPLDQLAEQYLKDEKP
jgi:hypothetical protein